MTFATSIHCMDGRVQEPILAWLKREFNVDYVDVITEPGPNKILANLAPPELLESVHTRVGISVQKHGSSVIAVSGHHDCAGNPVDKARQREQIEQSANYLAGKYPNVVIVKLWVNENWQVERL